MIRTRDVSIYAVGMIFQQVITFVSGVLVARWLGPGDYGVLSLARNVFSVALILAPLGLDLALLRHIGQHDGMRRQVDGEIAAIRGLVMTASLLAVAGILLAGPYIEHHFYRHEGFAKVLAITFLALPFSADLAVLGAVFRARQRPAPQVIIGLYVTPLLRFGLTLALLFAGVGVTSVLYATVVSAALAVGFLSYLLWRWDSNEGAVIRASLSTRLAAVRPLLGGSLWLALGLLVYGLLRSLDIFFLGAFRPDNEVGEYAALSVIAQLILFLPQALSQTMGAVVARQYAQDDLAGMKTTLLGYLRRASLLTAPVFGGIAVFSPWLDLVFGEKFHFRADVSLLLAVGCYVGAVLAPMGYSLSMTGRHRVESILLVTGLVTAAAACLLLVPAWGQLGAAAGTVCGYLVINAARVALVSRIHHVRLVQWHDFIPPLLAIALALATREWGGAVLGRSLPALVVLCAIYLVMCLGAWWLFLLGGVEKAFFSSKLGGLVAWNRA